MITKLFIKQAGQVDQQIVNLYTASSRSYYIFIYFSYCFLILCCYNTSDFQKRSKMFSLYIFCILFVHLNYFCILFIPMWFCIRLVTPDNTMYEYLQPAQNI